MKNTDNKFKKATLSLGLCAALGLSSLCGCSGRPGTADLTGGIKKLSGSPDSGSAQDESLSSGGGSAQDESLSGGGSSAQGGTQADEGSTQDSAKPADASSVTGFAVRLFQESLSQEHAKDPKKNVLVSPASVLFALSMTANGAKGQTLAQMEEVLGASVPGLNSYLHEYRTSLPDGDDCKLNIANSIWFKDDPDFTVNEDFLAANTTWYNADIYKASFDASTLTAINKWVSDNTDGMIPEILNDIPSDAIMYLINGIAFDAEWSDVYKEHQIREADFTEEDGAKCRTEFMYGNENVYLQDAYAQGFLKYYKGGQYAFAALLPNEGVAISDYVKNLDGVGLQEMLSGAVHMPVKTSIPKFETEYDVLMNDIFVKLGMTDAFDSNIADFSRLGAYTGQNIYINRILHKTYIAVDERGTKAGAATAVAVFNTTAILPQEEKEVYLDRPFVYLIIDCKENVPVFIGTLMSIK